MDESTGLRMGIWLGFGATDIYEKAGTCAGGEPHVYYAQGRGRVGGCGGVLERGDKEWNMFVK